MTATILTFPASQAAGRIRTVTLERLDGTCMAKGAFATGQPTAAWNWIEDQVAAETGCHPSLISVADDDVITADGFPVARVLL